VSVFGVCSARQIGKGGNVMSMVSKVLRNEETRAVVPSMRKAGGGSGSGRDGIRVNSIQLALSIKEARK
jgi:hypothetical protein